MMLAGLAEPITPECDLERRAALFAANAHGAIDQRRKYTFEPYICHPAAVAERVRSVPHTPEMLAAAWLHDVVEDTPVTIEEVLGAFGKNVAELVRWLTKVSRPEEGNRAMRQLIDRRYLARAPAPAQTVKLADIADNVSSIASRDPEFARVYLREKAACLEVLRNGDPVLIAWVEESLQEQACLLA